MNVSKDDLLLYAVTDRTWLNGTALCAAVEDALLGGATFIQLREKHMDDHALLAQDRKIQSLCRQYGVPFVLNDNVALARAIHADGVHVGQHDMTAAEARAQLGESAIIGVTARTVEQALLAQKHGADYLGVGAAFPTGSKADATVLDHATLRAICQAVSIPVIAIGGIHQGNVAQLAGSGICGVAVISAIFAAKDIRAATASLKAATQRMLTGKDASL